MEDVMQQQDLVAKSNGIGLNSNGNSWDEEYFSDHLHNLQAQQSTLAPSILQDLATTSNPSITTIVVVSLTIIFAIVVLFVLAIFIDYRQQKIVERQKQCIIVNKRRFPRIRLPRCGRIRQPAGIIEDAEETRRSRPPLEVISEVV